MTEKHYFADTSFLIDLFKGEEEAIQIMEEADSIATGSIVLYELAKISNFDKENIKQNKVFDLSCEDSEIAAEMHRKLSNKGEKIGEIDYLIAAQAKNTGRKLVTRDQDFQKLKIQTVDYKL